MSVRGATSATPAASSKVPPHRRESSIFGTPSVMGSRPSSVLSDANSATRTPVAMKGKAMDTPSTVKATLARSVRANGAAATTTSTVRKRSIEGAMGPPPTVSRTSSTSSTKETTPTRIPSASSSRASIVGPPSAFGKPAVTPTHIRRSSVSSRLPTPSASRDRDALSASSADEKEKENAAPKNRRMSMLAM